jgi:hypothetical protein
LDPATDAGSGAGRVEPGLLLRRQAWLGETRLGRAGWLGRRAAHAEGLVSCRSCYMVFIRNKATALRTPWSSDDFSGFYRHHVKKRLSFPECTRKLLRRPASIRQPRLGQSPVAQEHPMAKGDDTEDDPEKSIVRRAALAGLGAAFLAAPAGRASRPAAPARPPWPSPAQHV